MMKKKKHAKQEFEVIEQDAHFYYIMGYTSSGFPYGITWEEALEDGLIDENGEAPKVDIADEELPF